jgi:hypothetical protein
MPFRALEDKGKYRQSISPALDGFEMTSEK